MWRLSIADITGDSAFSRFPGINRSFLLAAGRSFRLTTDGLLQTLEAGAVVQFPGEADVSVEVAAEPAVAVNLLTRRGKCLGEIIVKSGHGLLRMDDASVAAVVLDGSAATSDGGQLGALDVVLPGPGAEALTCTNAVVALIRVKSQIAV
jgi:environmental stress-induced protein Ves